MDTETVVVSILFLILVIGCLAVAASQEKKLEDPTNTEVVYCDRISRISVLSGPGYFVLHTYRQSGISQKDDLLFSDPESAVHAAVITFTRAKIPYVVIESNTPSRLAFRRPYHDHRGRKEGKKVGAVEIQRITSRETA